jgi:protein-S-isoprenylcysteine O-methyltransferase Ste14
MGAVHSALQYNEGRIPVNTFLLVSSCVAELLAAFAVAYSILFPNRRIWPPASHPSWQSRLMASLFVYPSIGIGLLGVLEFGFLQSPLWCRVILGVPPLLAGLSLFLWAAAVLGVKPMSGGGGLIATSGPFRLTRNPQYVGCMVMLFGWTFLCASQAVAVASLFGAVPLLLAPFAEEHWLQERHGRRYEEYKNAVRRFL